MGVLMGYDSELFEIAATVLVGVITAGLGFGAWDMQNLRNEILAALSHDRWVTLDEIQTRTGLSQSRVWHTIRVLEARGIVWRDIHTTGDHVYQVARLAPRDESGGDE